MPHSETSGEQKRRRFVATLNEALDQLHRESSTIGRIPGLAGPIEDACKMLRDLIADCEGMPRMAFIGNTGVGKSTLINHLMGEDVAAVHPVFSQTGNLSVFRFPPPNGDEFELCDTRGLGEILASDEAANQLQRDLCANRPHLLIYVLNADSRAAIDRELTYLSKLMEHCLEVFHRPTQALFLLNRCDGITPAGFASLPPHPWEHAESGEDKKISVKRMNLSAKLAWFASVADGAGFPDAPQVPCAAEWLPERRIWNLSSIEEALYAQATSGLLLGLGETTNLQKQLERLALQLVRRFALIAATCAAVPLPFSDSLILVPLQIAMVKIVSAFGTKGTLSPMGVLEALGFVTQAGKLAAAQLLDLIPVLGQGINATIAATFTYGVGYLAVKHYVYGILPEADFFNDFTGLSRMWREAKDGR